MILADVAVVGGGPAGAAAAITLARAGRDVVLLDRAAFPRDKCCGDGLTTAALRRYEELGLQVDAVRSFQEASNVWLVGPSGRATSFPLPDGPGLFAAVARRADLDAALLDVARAGGAKVHDGHEVTGVRSDAGVVRLDVARLGTVAAHFVIAADGMWSRLRRLLDPPAAPYLGEWHAFRQYFTDVGPDASRDLWVWFEPDLLPGYAWSFPLPDGRANVGFGVLRRPGTATGPMAEQWGDLLRRPHVAAVLGPDAVAEGPHRAWPIPARLPDTSLSAVGGRVLFAGDAARASDPMTGEGIAQALDTGIEAATAILVAGPDAPDLAAARYQDRLRGMALDHRLARTLSSVLASPAAAEVVLRIAGATPWTRRNVARWLFEDYERAVLATPWRWRRHLFTGPGAYR